MQLNFKRGDVVNAFGQIAVIIDILRSEDTENACLYVRFAHNVGNARPYDILEISPGNTKGVENWQPADPKDFTHALTKRQGMVNREIEDLLTLIK
jgi:hypothetical protein